jgi:type IV pilus assembly protein PilV
MVRLRIFRQGPKPRRRGIALMEALVAIALLSLCALAYAALQLRGLSANSSSMWRSKATLLAYEMADRMRSNRVAVTAGQYNSLTVPQSITDCGSASSCSTTRMALLDYSLWSATLGRELPGGTGVVCLDDSPDDGSASAAACSGSGAMLADKVFWTERGQTARLAVAVRP